MNHMETSKGRIKIQSIYFNVAVMSSIGLPVVIFLYAFFTNSLIIFIPFAFIIPIICAIAWIAPFVRNVEIDKGNRLIIIRDGFASTSEIPFRSITGIEKKGGWNVVTYKRNDQLEKFRFALGYYTAQNQKRILDYIREFNPGVEIR